MVQRKNRNIEIARNFKKNIKGIKISKFLLFGSRAKGEEKRDSDFDIIVVSEDFKGKRWNRRPLEVYLSWNENKPLELLCYTPEEFNQLKNKITIVREAVREGIEI
jgi:predicted nucleotidyltransferase